MSEIIISGVLKTLKDLVSSREVVSLPGYRNGVRWLILELQKIQSVSEDAEERQYGDDTTENWASNIRELAYDIEDVLNAFHLKVLRKPGCFHDSVCCHVFYMGREMVKRYNMIKEIETFRHRIDELSSRRERYVLRDFGSGGGSTLRKLRELRRSVSFSVEKKVVGFEDDFCELLANLLEGDPWLSVISIYGMGGSGKTTLAGMLYHHHVVRSRFECRGWVSVSDDYTSRDLFLRIIKSFGSNYYPIKMDGLEKMTEEDLERYLKESLQGQSYLVVIDDVCEKEAWMILKGAFPDNKNGSRVIITTRNIEVAKHSDEITYAHELRALTEAESWQLFCEKALHFFKVDEVLEKLGREMVKKCNGLPLAIEVLGGLLSTKKPQEWPVVHEHLWQHLQAGSIEIRSLFALSYNSLPYQLKPCLLYLSCFPNDFEINIEKFIHLLVAEDFIPRVQNCTIEDVAKDYLNELINRNLIQVGQIYWGRILTCRIHEILRNFAIKKAKHIFFVCYDEVKHSNISSIISPPCPRQVIYSSTESPSWLQKCNPRMRSIFLYGEYQFSVPMCKRFSCLRVLVDGSIGNDYVTRKLIHLKYLGLKDSSIFLLPSIVFNMSRLQTLYVPRSVFPVSLPAGICKSQEMRHLIGNFSCVPSSIQSLTNLQTLRSITNIAWAEIETEKLVNLRELWLGGPLKGLQVFSFDSMANLTSLRILSVELGHDDDSFGSLRPLSHCRHLMDLRLRGKMENLPEDILRVLRNLECLSLRDSRLNDDPMPLLENLPYLKILHLGCRFYSKKKIMCSADGFPQLEILLFDEHKFQIEEWQVQEGALLRLKGLRIPENFKVKIPERLRSLPTPDPREYTTKLPDDVELLYTEG